MTCITFSLSLSQPLTLILLGFPAHPFLAFLLPLLLLPLLLLVLLLLLFALLLLLALPLLLLALLPITPLVLPVCLSLRPRPANIDGDSNDNVVDDPLRASSSDQATSPSASLLDSPWRSLAPAFKAAVAAALIGKKEVVDDEDNDNILYASASCAAEEAVPTENDAGAVTSVVPAALAAAVAVEASTICQTDDCKIAAAAFGQE